MPSPDSDGAYRIPLVVNGTSANIVKGILYSPGCQIQLLSVDLKTTSDLTAAFECRPLPFVKLKGIISPPPTDPLRLSVTVYYMATWNHVFFGFGDGAVEQSNLGSWPLNR